MSYDAAIKALLRRKEEEAIEFDVQEHLPGAFWDAGLAFYRAMQRTYGWVSTQGVVGWFGLRHKPQLVTVRTGPGPKDVIQLPMGEFSLPNLRNPINARPMMKDGVPGFQVWTRARKAEQAALIELCNLARKILREESVYRGNAIRLKIDDDGQLAFGEQPEFLDLSSVSEDSLVFNSDTRRLIETNLFTPMKKTAICRQHRIPLKRTILMEGPYGCGKSLTSRVAAKVATDNDWTFIALDRCQTLKQAIEFARLYQPAIIFAEDIDRIGSRDEDETVNDLVNMVDGILSKDLEIMVVLTTNHIDRIDQSLLRPGRFDAVIRIDAPDAEAVEKLFRHYAGELIAEDADLRDAAEVVAGQIPATIREVVERAKLGMILDERQTLEPVHLRTAAVGMKRHLELLAPKVAAKTSAELLAEGLQGIVGKGGGGVVDPRLLGLLDSTYRMARSADGNASDANDAGRSAASTASEVLDEVRELKEQLNGG